MAVAAAKIKILKDNAPASPTEKDRPQDAGGGEKGQAAPPASGST